MSWAVGDLDGDSLHDLVLEMSGGPTFWFQNDGNGSLRVSTRSNFCDYSNDFWRALEEEGYQKEEAGWVPGMVDYPLVPEVSKGWTSPDRRTDDLTRCERKETEARRFFFFSTFFFFFW